MASQHARVRFGVAWLKGAEKVTVHRHVIVEIDEE